MLNRRNFLKAGFLSSAIFIFNGCELFGVTTPSQTLDLLGFDLLPKAKELNINLPKYYKIILNHSRIDESDKDFIKNGVKWLNEECVKVYKKNYFLLNATQREKILHLISKESWGESFLSNMISYTLEAFYSDPIYGVNDGSSWSWCNFRAGLPQPKEALL